MNDAPSDDHQATKVDAAMVSAEIAVRAVCGLDYKVILALGPDRADPAGATEVFVNRHRPVRPLQRAGDYPPACSSFLSIGSRTMLHSRLGRQFVSRRACISQPETAKC